MATFQHYIRQTHNNIEKKQGKTPAIFNMGKERSPYTYPCIPLYSRNCSFKITFDIDLYEYMNYKWVYNALGVVFVAAVIVWFLKKFPDKGIEQSITSYRILKNSKKKINKKT